MPEHSRRGQYTAGDREPGRARAEGGAAQVHAADQPQGPENRAQRVHATVFVAGWWR